MSDRLLNLLGIEIPILQAPTGSIAGPELASAVSNAGGLGALGLTWTPTEEAVAAVQQVRESTDRPFLVNFVLSFTPEALEAILEAGAPIVTFSWGDPAPYLPAVRAAGAKVGVQVANPSGARRALALGVDFLICQGVEAGGHVQSSTALETLLPAVLEVVGESVPIVAAGGLTDGRDVARALAHGAEGIMLGTRFVATQESRAHPDYKQRLLASREGETALTLCFDGGWPNAAHRVLRNTTLEAWEAAGSSPPGHRPAEGEKVAQTSSGSPILRYEDTAPRLGMTGDVEAMALYAGEGVARIADLPKAGELIRRLWEETQAVCESTRRR